MHSFVGGSRSRAESVAADGATPSSRPAARQAQQLDTGFAVNLTQLLGTPVCAWAPPLHAIPRVLPYGASALPSLTAPIKAAYDLIYSLATAKNCSRLARLTLGLRSGPQPQLQNLPVLGPPQAPNFPGVPSAHIKLVACKRQACAHQASFPPGRAQQRWRPTRGPRQTAARAARPRGSSHSRLGSASACSLRGECPHT